MPLERPGSPVTYAQMIDYVARVTDPIARDMDGHNDWHRDQLAVSARADRAARIAMLGVWVAVAALVASIVLGIVYHH